MSIVDSGPRVVDLTPGAGLGAQRLREELSACRAQLGDCQAGLTIPPILNEVARLIAAEPLANWMAHVTTILETLDGEVADGAGFVVELHRLAEAVTTRAGEGAWMLAKHSAQC